MRYLTIVLTTTLLTLGAAHSQETLQLRYQGDSGPMTLALSHDIEVKEPLAGREMSFEVTLDTDPSTASGSLEIGKASASFTAHGMTQRLGTRHLTGSTVSLALSQDGRRIVEVEPTEAPIIDVGPPVVGGFSVAAMLTGVLPELPEGPVSKGATWSSEREVRLLEGWAWGSGAVTSHHQVTSVESSGGKTIVNVETRSEGTLRSDDGDRAYAGKLERSLRWSFDVTGGRVLSLSLEQKTDGITTLPQGELPLVQLTTLELASAA